MWLSIISFSQILSVGILAMGVATIGSALFFFTSAKARKYLLSFDYYDYIKAIGVVAGVSVAGALIYEFYYLTDVCFLCWWQRIFFFPLLVIIPLAIKYKEKTAHITTAVMSAIGGAIALYHYYHHFMSFTLDREVSIFCNTVGNGPSCAETPFIIFGFITIPFMGVVMFLVLLWLAFLAEKRKKML